MAAPWRAGHSGPVPTRACVLTLNGGSASIRFAVYGTGASPSPLLAGIVRRVGLPGTVLSITHGPTPGPPPGPRAAAGEGHAAALGHLLDWLEAQPEFRGLGAVGHRVVHGMRRSAPARVTPALLADLRRNTPYDPDHLPCEIGLIEAVSRRYPGLPQVACFDTAFHRSMPRVARLLPIPRRFAAMGVERYGFHGLSYTYLVGELRRLDPAAARGRVILAHLGGGASLAAVRRGRSLDTSMGFTPAGGLVMGTRSGDLDPGILAFLARRARMTPAGFDRMANHESGLLGVSGTSPDMADLIGREARDPRAADAIALFCAQARKWVGAFAATLGGVDTLVFSGGIGENAPSIRARICAGLGFLGLRLGPARNARGAAVISAAGSRVTVRVIRTDEERVIARETARLLRRQARARTL